MAHNASQWDSSNWRTLTRLLLSSLWLTVLIGGIIRTPGKLWNGLSNKIGSRQRGKLIWFTVIIYDISSEII